MLRRRMHLPKVRAVKQNLCKLLYNITIERSTVRTMKKSATARGPRPGSIARIAGIDYADLDEHMGYALKRAQIASFEAFSRATAGDDITPPRFTALVILAGNPGMSQSALGEVLGTARSGAMMLTDWLEQRGL